MSNALDFGLSSPVYRLGDLLPVIRFDLPLRCESAAQAIVHLGGLKRTARAVYGAEDLETTAPTLITRPHDVECSPSAGAHIEPVPAFVLTVRRQAAGAAEAQETKAVVWGLVHRHWCFPRLLDFRFLHREGRSVPASSDAGALSSGDNYVKFRGGPALLEHDELPEELLQKEDAYEMWTPPRWFLREFGEFPPPRSYCKQSFLSSLQPPQRLQQQLLNAFFAAATSHFPSMQQLQSAVPQLPLPVPFVESTRMPLLVKTLQKLFALCVGWRGATLSALLSLASSHTASRDWQHALRGVAYRSSKRCYVSTLFKCGYDPREDPSSVLLHTLQVKQPVTTTASSSKKISESDALEASRRRAGAFTNSSPAPHWARGGSMGDRAPRPRLPVPQYIGTTRLDPTKHSFMTTPGELLVEPSMHGLAVEGGVSRGELGLLEMASNMKQADWPALGRVLAGCTSVTQAAHGLVAGAPPHDTLKAPYIQGMARAVAVARPLSESEAAAAALLPFSDLTTWPPALLPCATLVHTAPLGDVSVIRGAQQAMQDACPPGDVSLPELPQPPSDTEWCLPGDNISTVCRAAWRDRGSERPPPVAQIEGVQQINDEVRFIMALLRGILREYAVWWTNSNLNATCPLLSRAPADVARCNTQLALTALQLSPTLRLRQLAALQQMGALADSYCPDSGWLAANLEPKLRVRACILLWGASPEPSAEPAGVPPRELFRWYALQPEVLAEAEAKWSASTAGAAAGADGAASASGHMLLPSSALLPAAASSDGPQPAAASALAPGDAGTRANEVFASFPSISSASP